MPQNRVPAVFMRGGTSKGLFLHARDLPEAGELRDRMILEILGSPDPGQIDGLGSGTSSTSKMMAVSRSERSDADIDYFFGQASVDRPVMDYRANCGNLTAAVGPFAIDEGLVDTINEPISVLTLHNVNTGVRVRAHVPVHEGRAAVQGDHRIAGVPRPGAKIVTEFLDPAGSVFDGLFPTGRASEKLVTAHGEVEVSIVDVANPSIFVRATDVGLRGDETPSEVNADRPLQARLEEVRATGAVRLGLVEDAADAAQTSPSLPFLMLVSEPSHNDADLRAQVMSVQLMHHACPMTALMCASAAALLPGTVVNAVVEAPDGEVRVQHPKGIAAATVSLSDRDGTPHVESVSVTRTARRIMAGHAYYRT